VIEILDDAQAIAPVAEHRAAASGVGEAIDRDDRRREVEDRPDKRSRTS
jgi:hypothetical protein